MLSATSHPKPKEVKLPQYLRDIEELPKFIQENQLKLFPKEDTTIEYVINYYIEKNKTDEAFFIIDLGVILEQFKKWKSLMPRFEPYYQVKCCPNSLVLNFLALLGCNFVGSSKTEIINVTELNIPSSKILYANPIKDSHYIKFARSQDVDFMTFDSETELYKIKLYHPYSKLMIQIKVKEGKVPNKFSDHTGCSMAESKVLLEKAKFLDLNVMGVCFNVGTRCSDAELFEDTIREARKIFSIAKDLGIQMTTLDVGGGFPGHDQESTVKFEEISKVLNDSIDKYFHDIEDLKLVAEPCRFFVTRSHTLVFNVIGKKKVVEEDGEKQFLYYMNEGVYGSFNCIMYDGAFPEICPFNERNEKRYKSTIFGPTCDSMDTISRNMELPELVVGEWCFVENFGAYTQAAASTFNGFQMIENNYIIIY